MAKAASELGKGKPDTAIDHFGKAWRHAVKAAPAGGQQTFTLHSCNAADLIAAMTQANATVDADTIVLKAGCTYTLTSGFYDDGTNGPSGLPIVLQPLTIHGNNATITRDSGAPAFRLLQVAGVALAVDGVTFTGGSATVSGGAIYAASPIVAGSLALTNSTFATNKAVKSGGAVAADSLASVELVGDTFDGNTQTGDDPSGWSAGGAVSVVGPAPASLHVADSHFTGNVAVAPYGGAMQAEAHSVLIEHSDFTDNVTEDGQGIGGAVKANPGQEITFDDCTFTGNRGGGGAIANEGEGTGHMLIKNSHFVGNVSTGFGAVGGYRPYGSLLTVENSTFTENIGGALNAAATTIVRGSTFDENTNGPWAGGAIAAGPWVVPATSPS